MHPALSGLSRRKTRSDVGRLPVPAPCHLVHRLAIPASPSRLERDPTLHKAFVAEAPPHAGRVPTSARPVDGRPLCGPGGRHTFT